MKERAKNVCVSQRKREIKMYETWYVFRRVTQGVNRSSEENIACEQNIMTLGHLHSHLVAEGVRKRRERERERKKDTLATMNAALRKGRRKQIKKIHSVCKNSCTMNNCDLSVKCT